MRETRSFRFPLVGDGGDRPLFLDDEGGVVFDTGDQRRPRIDDLGEQCVVSVTTIEDLKPVGLKGTGQYGTFGTGRRRQGAHPVGTPLEDVEVEMKLDSPVIGVLPERPDHSQQRCEDRVVDSGESFNAPRPRDRSTAARPERPVPGRAGRRRHTPGGSVWPSSHTA